MFVLMIVKDELKGEEASIATSSTKLEVMNYCSKHVQKLILSDLPRQEIPHTLGLRKADGMLPINLLGFNSL